jgi:hypothetical protein
MGPAPVRLAAARGAADPEAVWMLRQPRRVRASFAREVLNADRPEHVATEIWMLRQPKPVRESYIKEVLEGGS